MKINYTLEDLPPDAQKLVRIFRLHRFIDAASVGPFSVVLLLTLQDRGFSLFDISILFAVFTGTRLILEIPLGGLADGIGRKPVFMLSVVALLLSVATLIIFDGFWLTMLSLVFMSARMALMSGTLVAWFVEKFKQLAPTYSTQLVLAKTQFSGAIGLAISSIIGGFSVDFFGARFMHWGITKYEVPLIGSLIFGIFVLLFTHYLIIETTHKVNRKAIIGGFSNLGNIISDAGHYGFSNRLISSILIGVACTSLAFFTFQAFWVPFVKPMLNDQYAASIIGILTFVFFFMVGLGSEIAKPTIVFFGHKMAHALGVLTFMCALCLIAISTTTNIYSFVALLLIYTIFIGSINSPYNSIFHDHIPDDKRSTLLSFASLMQGLGGLVGMLFIGYIADIFGIAMAWKVGSVFLFGASLIYITLQSRIHYISNH